MQSTVNHSTRYDGEHLSNVAYPLGGLGAGMFCMEGTGALSQFSLRHQPELVAEPNVFAALAMNDGNGVTARVLEGPVPRRKVWNTTNTNSFQGKGAGLPGRNYGLPRFADCAFQARFPFANVSLSDSSLPVRAEITAWSPFVPGDDLNSGLPCATLEYSFSNTGKSPLNCVFYFAAANLMTQDKERGSVTPAEGGFTLSQNPSEEKPSDEGYLRIVTDSPDAAVDVAWFRGGWFDSFTMLWNQIKEGRYANKTYDCADGQSAGGTLAVPLSLQPGESQTIRVHFAWFVPVSHLKYGEDAEVYGEGVPASYQPWYATKFDSIGAVMDYYRSQVSDLRAQTEQFSNTLFDTSLPDVVLDAISANLCILKSPTILRQHDGRIWCWEGCHDLEGSCHGSCTHVWNYAQAICHLFPALERSLRQTEFYENQDDKGHQVFRASLPIRPTTHTFYAAADGQLGGIMKVYREWRISGDTEWLKGIWPRVRQSLAYAVTEWDPQSEGVIRQPHHNTYDIEFFGVEPLCTVMYLGALKAAACMARELGDSEQASEYEVLREKGAAYMAEKLFNGEYLYQDIEWTASDNGDVPVPGMGGGISPEAKELILEEGPKYQYGTGCLSDGVLGAWMANLYGLGDVMDSDMVRSHLRSIFEYNLKEDLSTHENTQRPGYAFGEEGGLLLCTWPRGGKLSLPFVYSDEVWTGIEYHVASHLILEGYVREGERIIEVLRSRYNGAERNPYDEYECGHWYARALSSYALLQAYTGARYDRVTRTLYIRPAVDGDVRALLCVDGGYGLAGVKDGEPFYQAVAGDCVIDRICYESKGFGA